jgi:hypothetical protein
MKTKEQATTDLEFIREIIAEIEENGYIRGGLADVMLHDWEHELQQKANEE